MFFLIHFQEHKLTKLTCKSYFCFTRSAILYAEELAWGEKGLVSMLADKCPAEHMGPGTPAQPPQHLPQNHPVPIKKQWKTTDSLLDSFISKCVNN